MSWMNRDNLCSLIKDELDKNKLILHAFNYSSQTSSQITPSQITSSQIIPSQITPSQTTFQTTSQITSQTTPVPINLPSLDALNNFYVPIIPK